jgi:mannose-1-phosphate guanylyltransferase/mannose-6-phosphate isomerase
VIKIIPVLLAGGSGTRLWPMSTRQKPKQFHRIGADHTLFQQTILRARGEAGQVRFEKPIIVSNDQFGDLIVEQLREIDVEAEAIILEPVGRNTAPAVAIAALYAEERWPDAQLLFLPADHVMTDVDAFRDAVARAAEIASGGRLITFGIAPAAPETGYGYILRGSQLADGYVVDSFVEKPNRATAEKYLADGRYYWNAGIFLFPVGTVLRELRQHAPAMLQGAQQALSRSRMNGIQMNLNAEAFGSIVPISVDYALMEKASGAVVVPMSAGWSDVGSWTAFAELGMTDADRARLLIHNSDGSFALSSGPKIAVIGVPDVMVIATPEGTLVIDKKLAQDVKLAYMRFEEPSAKGA